MNTFQIVLSIVIWISGAFFVAHAVKQSAFDELRVKWTNMMAEEGDSQLDDILNAKVVNHLIFIMREILIALSWATVLFVIVWLAFDVLRVVVKSKKAKR